MHVDCGHIVTEPKPPKIQTKNHTVWLEKDGIDFALYCLALDCGLTKTIFSSYCNYNSTILFQTIIVLCLLARIIYS